MKKQRRRAAKPPAQVSEPAGWPYHSLSSDSPESAKLAAARHYRTGNVSSDRILEVAREMFASEGYQGTTIRGIVLGAEVNIGAVTYHFGSKEDLYHFILRGLIGPLAHRVEVICDSDLAPLEKIRKTVEEFFAHQARNPAMVPIMVREMASSSPLAAPIASGVQKMLTCLVSTIVEGQQKSLIRPGDPTLLALSCIAQPVYLNLARKGIAAATGMDPTAPELRERLVSHCVTVIQAALENRP